MNRVLVSVVVGLLLLAASVAPVSAQPAQPVTTPRTIQCSVAQTVTASSAYASGNVVGGKISCANAVRSGGLGGLIQTVWVSDKSGQIQPYEFWPFNSDPSATTVTNKSAIAINAADLSKVAAPPIVIPSTATVLGATTTMGITGASGLATSFRLADGNTTLYGILVTRGTPTYTSTSDVGVYLTIIPD